jgi:hypothetical protein
LKAQSTGPDISASIVKVLIHRLKPSDLDFPTEKLRARLNIIGSDEELFQVAEDGSDSESPAIPMPGLSKVSGSTREVMVVLEPTQRSDSPSLTYWIGVQHGLLNARAIPPNPDRMIGPTYGAWRRRGKYLVGVGYAAVYHSQKWADAEIFVFKDSKKGLGMEQRIHIEGCGVPFGFASISSLTIECRQTAKDDYETIQPGRQTLPTCEKVWMFRNGRYVLVRTTPNHDELWAIDRLMTAVSKKKITFVNAMIPNRLSQKIFLRRLQEALNHEAIHVDEYRRTTLSSRRYPGYGISIEIVKTNSGWSVRNVRTMHFSEQ